MRGCRLQDGETTKKSAAERGERGCRQHDGGTAKKSTVGGEGGYRLQDVITVMKSNIEKSHLLAYSSLGLLSVIARSRGMQIAEGITNV